MKEIISGLHLVQSSTERHFVLHPSFLETALNRTDNVREELAGNLWAVHGGGFYYLEKYKTAPKEIPKTLHWFKYEAYFTWLSGFSLLFIIYYFDAQAFLVDKMFWILHRWPAFPWASVRLQLHGLSITFSADHRC